MGLLTPYHTAFMARPLPVRQHRGAPNPVDRYMELMSWLASQPITPLGDITARRHHVVTREIHDGWLRDMCDLIHEAISDIGSICGILGTLSRGIPQLPVTTQAAEEIAGALLGAHGKAGILRDILPINQQAKALHWGIAAGVVPVRVVPSQGGRGFPRATRRIEVWEPRFLRYSWSEDVWYIDLATGPMQLENMLLEDGSQEFYLWTPYDHARPWRLAPWPYLTLMGIMMRDGMYARGRHAQVLAPRRVVEYTEGWSEPQRQKMIQILEAMSYNGYLLLPPGTKYSIANVSGNDITAVYKAILDFCREEVEIGLTGQKVTTEGGKGFSTGDVQRDIHSVQLAFYAGSWADFTSRIAVDPCMRDNFGDDIDPVAYAFNTKPIDRLVEEADALGKLGDSMKRLREGADAIGGEVSASDPAIQALFRKFGVTVRPKPEAAVPVAKLDLAPTDVAKCVRVDEVRVANGLPPIGGEEGQTMLADMGNPSPIPPAPEVPNA